MDTLRRIVAFLASTPTLTPSERAILEGEAFTIRVKHRSTVFVRRCKLTKNGERVYDYTFGPHGIGQGIYPALRV